MTSTSTSASVSGFTLIDLMITIAIASVLAEIAIPTYRDHIQRSQITEARSQLLVLKLQLEQYYQDNRNYGVGTNGNACGIRLPIQNNFFYTCTIEDKGQSYLLKASGINGRGVQEFEFTLNTAGQQRTTRMPPSWGVVPMNCWIEKKGVAC